MINSSESFMIDVLPLFPALNTALIDLLKSLKPADWDRKTVCANWTVKDIAVHLLDTSLRRLSIGRDEYQPQKNQQFGTYEELVAHLNKLNADWVTAMKRLSPNLIIDMLENYQQKQFDYFKELDPVDMAMFQVVWAGKEHSENWFDMAREYTERWLHQQQIRQAMNNQDLLQPKFYTPFLNISMQDLPHTYSKVKASFGSTVKVEIVGDAGGLWTIKKEKGFWRFTDEESKSPDGLVYIDQQIAWLLFSKGMKPMDATPYFQLHGDTELASHALNMIAVMA